MMIIIHVLITFPFRTYIHRVLYLAMSPDGQNIVTGAGDPNTKCRFTQSMYMITTSIFHRRRDFKVLECFPRTEE